MGQRKSWGAWLGLLVSTQEEDGKYWNLHVIPVLLWALYTQKRYMYR